MHFTRRIGAAHPPKRGEMGIWPSRPRFRRPRIARSRLGRGVLAISGSAVLAQLVAVAAAPVLTRLYPPEAYGAFFVVNSVSVVLAAGLALRLELAIPLPSEDDDARRLLTLAVTAIAVMLLAVTLVLITWSPAIASRLAVPGSPWIMVLAGPLAASVAVFAVLNAVAVREMRFGAIARRQIVVATMTVALQLIAGFQGSGVSGLVISTLVAQLLGAASLLWGSPFLRRRVAITRAQLRRTLTRYKKFPLVLAPAGWLNSLGANAPVIVIAAMYGSQAAGWFGLMLRIAALPASFVGMAVARVYISELALRRRAGTGTEADLFFRTSRILAAAAVALGTSLFIFGPLAFETIFGPSWEVSGSMARAYAVAAAAQILVSPLSETLVVYERVVVQILWDASRMLVIVGSLVLAWWVDLSVVTAVWILAGATLCCYVANWEVCRRTVMRGARRGALIATV